MKTNEQDSQINISNGYNDIKAETSLTVVCPHINKNRPLDYLKDWQLSPNFSANPMKPWISAMFIGWLISVIVTLAG